jgi:hypothetical protein
MTSPAIKVATIPMMAMDKGDWFPVSFSSGALSVGSTVVVAKIEILVAVGFDFEVGLSS